MPVTLFSYSTPGSAGPDDGYIYGNSGSTTVLQPSTASTVNTASVAIYTGQQFVGAGWEQRHTLVRFAGMQSLPDDATLTSVELILWSGPNTTTVAPSAALNVVAQWVSPSLWPITTALWSTTMTPDAHSGTPISEWANPSTTQFKAVALNLSNVSEAQIPYRGVAGTTYAALRVWLDITGRDNTITNQVIGWGSNDRADSAGPQLRITWQGPANTADRIYYLGQAPSGRAKQLFRFKNGALLLINRHPDTGYDYFVRPKDGVWTHRANGDLGTAGQPYWALAARPNRADDTAYMLYNSVTGVRLRQVTGNPDGTLTFGAAVTVTTTSSGAAGLDLLVDNSGYVHVFHVIAGAGNGWTHRVYDATLTTNIRETRNVGSANVTHDAASIFHYDQLNNRIVLEMNTSQYLDARVCTLGTTITASSGITWNATISATGIVTNARGGTAYCSPDGVVQILRTGSNGIATWYQFTTGFINKGIVGAPAAPYTYWASLPHIRTTSDGQIWVFGQCYKGTGTAIYRMGHVLWNGGAAAWGDPVFSTPDPGLTYGQLGLTTTDSDTPDSPAWVGNAQAGTLTGGGVYEGHSALWQPSAPGYSNVAGEVRRWFAGNWNREGQRFGGMSPF